MNHFDRQVEAARAAGEARGLADQLDDLADLDRWYTSRLIKARNSAANFVEAVNEVLKTELEVAPITTSEDVASQSTEVSDVIVRVEGVVRTTSHGATIFKTPGLVGGYFNGTFKNGYRPNNERAIPNREIARGFDPLTKSIKVNRKWFMEPTQADLRAYSETVK